MSDYPDGSRLREAVSGNWHRIEKGAGGGSMLIELDKKLLIDIHISTKRIDILLKDDEGIFRHMGDLALDGLRDPRVRKMMFHSQAIDHIHFNNQDIQIDNPECDLTDVVIQLTHEKKNQTKTKKFGHS